MTKKSKRQTDSQVENEEREIKEEARPDGKWGWFIVFNSFICNMIVDGLQYTFANFLMPMSVTLQETVSSVSLIGSLLSGFYNFSGPIAGALGNKFGFRMATITGSFISAGGLMLSYFTPHIGYLYFFYGILGGLGFGMIYMASVIITSLYFEKYRALAASLSVCGTGVGTFVFAPLGNFLVTAWGWRLALVMEGAIILLCVLCGLSFKPLGTITVIPLSKSPSVMSLESLPRRGSVYYPVESKRTQPNEAYPTFKEALQMQGTTGEERRMTIASAYRGRRSTFDSLATRQMPIFSVVGSSIKLREKSPKTLNLKCQKCCRVCCFNFWHCQCRKKALTLGDRPLYRDDIFYEGSLVTLPRYNPDGVNYQLSVTRVPDMQEIQQHETQKCCVCHPAFLRTCVTMLGFHLLKSKIFVFLCVSSFFYTMALYIPYVFIRRLAEDFEVPEDESVWMVSAIGICNTAGRLASGIIKSFFKVNASVFVLVGLTISGVVSFVFLFGRNMTWILIFSCIFGFFTAPFISLRPVIIVDFLGLEKLTNAFGLVLLSQGVASILGPPLAGLLEEATGEVSYVIYFSGSLMLAAGLSLLASVVLNSVLFTAERRESKGSHGTENENQVRPNVDMVQRKKAPRASMPKPQPQPQPQLQPQPEPQPEPEPQPQPQLQPQREDNADTYTIIPPNGGWGWVVVVCAFYCNVVVDGIQLTFGVFLNPISESFHAEVAEVALAGSLMFGIHLLMGPLCAGFSKVFGLRPVTIVGALICCAGVGVSYFATGYWFLYFSFGVVGGMGLGLVYMNSLIITSVYFTTLMPIAIAIVVCGTGVGTMVFAIAGQHLLQVTSWRDSFLVEAALAGSMAFAAASFKPLHPVRVELSPEPSTSRLPSSAAPAVPNDLPENTNRRKTVFIKTASNASILGLQSAIWNLAEEAVIAKAPKKEVCKCCIWPCCPKKRKAAPVQDILVLSEMPDSSRQRRKSYSEKDHVHEEVQNSNFTRIDVDNSRKKAAYALKKSILATLDCRLMRSFSFVMFTISGAFQMAGFFIVFIYEKERSTSMGFSEDMSVYFVVVLGGANTVWRLVLGGLATLPKVNYWALAISGIVLGGVAAICSGFSPNMYYQFMFCCFFGLGIASFAVFRIVLLVDIVGIEKIDNATGIQLLFMGIFCIISPPVFGWIMLAANSYNTIFVITGLMIIVSGLMLMGLDKVKL